MPKGKVKKKEPSWLVHFHYGRDGTPYTVYDNHDGTFTLMDDRGVSANVTAEIALRAFTRKVNELACHGIKMTG